MIMGKYICFDGCDGGGKSTQSQMLYHFLKGKGLECTLTKEPGGTKLGEKIRLILLNKDGIGISSLEEVFLYQADRSAKYKEIVIPALERKEIVISDRSWASTYAYQGVAGGVDTKIINSLTRLTTQEITPDLLFILDILPEQGLKKETNPDRFAKKGLKYHKNVREGFLQIADTRPFTIVINYQEGNPGAMQQEIRNFVKERLNI